MLLVRPEVWGHGGKIGGGTCIFPTAPLAQGACAGDEGQTPLVTLENFRRMAMPLFIAALTVAAITMPTVHAGGGCVPPDCEREDDGTCGMACCKLRWEVPSMEAKPFADRVFSFLASGGADKLYNATINSPSVQPWADDSSWVVQGTHLTAKHIYTDSLIFASMPNPEKSKNGSVVVAFSHSQENIKGNFAYSDDGQNYKNLAQLIKTLGVAYSEQTVFGCPKPHA